MRANNAGNNAGKYAGRFETCPYGWISKQIRIMHNGFPNGWISRQLRIIHYPQWIFQWMDIPTIMNYALCTMDFPNGCIPQTITNYAL